MSPTRYQNVNKLLDELLANIKSIFGGRLVGLYLYGSLVWGDFDQDVSDIDLLTVLTDDVNEKEFDELKSMHKYLVKNHPEWNDRIEVYYASISAVNSVRTKKEEVVNIGPGEPFSRIKSEKNWLLRWYLVREKSIPLFGPSSKTVIEAISKDEFIESVKDHARLWTEWVKGMRNPYAQSYAILTLCRALYAYRNGNQTSKKQAAHWVQKEFPEWSELIQDALEWRRGGKYKPAEGATYPRTVEFVNFTRAIILAE